MDLRPVGLSLRVSFSHSWFSTWWEPPSFFNKIVSDSPFKSAHAMPGLLRHGSPWTFNLMAKLFSALGTLENQSSSASCSHLPSWWGKDGNCHCEYSYLERTLGKPVGVDGASPCAPVLLFWVLGGLWRRAGLRLLLTTRDGLLLLVLQSPQGCTISEAPLFFLAATKVLSATFKDCDTESVGAQPSPSLFFILLIFFSPLLSHLRVTSERFLPLKLSACPWEGDILHCGLLFSAVELQSEK